MFHKINLLLASLALALFTTAQHQGWNLFDDAANPGGGKSTSSRLSHK